MTQTGIKEAVDMLINLKNELTAVDDDLPSYLKNRREDVTNIIKKLYEAEMDFTRLQTILRCKVEEIGVNNQLINIIEKILNRRCEYESE